MASVFTLEGPILGAVAQATITAAIQRLREFETILNKWIAEGRGSQYLLITNDTGLRTGKTAEIVYISSGLFDLYDRAASYADSFLILLELDRETDIGSRLYAIGKTLTKPANYTMGHVQDALTQVKALIRKLILVPVSVPAPTPAPPKPITRPNHDVKIAAGIVAGVVVIATGVSLITSPRGA